MSHPPEGAGRPVRREYAEIGGLLREGRLGYPQVGRLSYPTFQIDR